MRRWVLAGVLALFVIAYLAPLGARPLFQPDEFRYAEIPREMLASGDWVVPRLDGLRYFEKPVMGYWLTAASMAVFGENNFSVRLPVALSAGVTVLAVLLLVRRFGGGLVQAAAVTGVLLTSGMFYLIGCFNTLDMPLTMFLSVGLVSFYWAFQAEDFRRKALYLGLSGLAIGGAFLTKGFLAFAVPCAAIVPFMLWERRTGKLLRLAWVAVIAVLLIALPWCLMIYRREPDFWPEFFWREHVRRFFSEKAQHAEPFWFFIPFLLGGALPWTVFAPAAIVGLWRERLKDPLIRFALCWLVFPFLFFSISRGKLGTYILPCFPPLAVLLGLGLVRYFQKEKRRAFVAGAWVFMCLLAACAAALLAGWLAGVKVFPYRSGEEWKWLFILAGAAFWVAALRIAINPRASPQRLFWLCAAPCLFMVATQFALPKAIEDLCAPEAFLARDSARVAPGAPLFARAGMVHAVAWHYKRADVYLLASTGEFDYGLSCSDATGRELELDNFKRFVAKCPSTTLVTAIVERDFYDRVKGQLPKAEYEDMNEGFVFVQYRGGALPSGDRRGTAR